MRMNDAKIIASKASPILGEDIASAPRVMRESSSNEEMMMIEIRIAIPAFLS